MDVTASGTLNDSSILGGTIPQLAFDAAVAHDTAHVKADGSFAGFDPAVASGKPEAEGQRRRARSTSTPPIAHLSGGVTPDSVQADGKVTLEPSTIGGLEITRASLDGDYHDATGDIRTLEVAGRDLNVQASGTLALNETGQSNLKVHADSPEPRGDRQAGRSAADRHRQDRRDRDRQPARAEGDRHAGRRRREVRRQRRADRVERLHRDGAGADDRRRATSSADTHATFVDDRAARTSTSSTPRPTYKQKQLDFDATAKQPQRSLGAAGSLLLHPDHQEVHLQRLGLTDAGADLAAGAGLGGDDQLRARRGGGEQPHAGQRRSADRGRRHVRPAGRCAEGDADQRRSRQRRRAAAAAAAVDRHASTRRRRSAARRPRRT